MKKSQTQRAPQTKWIEVPQNLKLGVPFLKATPLRPIGTDAVQYEAITDRGPIKIQVPNTASFLMSHGGIYDDMCDMDILNEPQILNNLVCRYKNGKIFTFIGPTLIVVNPYRVIAEYFSHQTMSKIRDKILSRSIGTQAPHIYLIAGNAYISMIDQEKKQAIVISGESGAGKTESTKYCMQILTSLSHRQSLPIQAKILACNPLLEAFGNSKTIRNDNSSRFGKYVQIYFSGDNTIAGASINSYLLEKSRVVSAAQRQRSFHIFYALIASGTTGLGKPSQYNYLSRSKCYQAAGIDDKQYFTQIKKSMKSIGFNEKQENKIWDLLVSILELGNIQFDDKTHKQDQSIPCLVTNKKQMEKIAKRLGLNEKDLQKILLYEKKKFLKQYTFSPYNKNKCTYNLNTLSKAIYNSIFEFILYKIQRSLQPQKNKKYHSINILDIFGFQNFDNNSFQQFCINYTNQKLLKLYNSYVFERQLQILKQDGLEEQVSDIKAPTNQGVIQIISGPLSVFSIVNDFTMPQQFKDSDIIQGFESKLSKSPYIKFDKIQKTKFTIVHSQCNVKYDIQGFKQKNQDKVIPEISDIVTNLFEHQSKEQAGKTLLNKFSTEIEELVVQLNSSCVHFIRCIKPNEKKMPHLAQESYMITQIRYLGVFQTIQIRKKTFPARWLYSQFLERFQILYGKTAGNQKVRTENVLKQLTTNVKDYLLGNQRVYMNSQLQIKLSKKLHQQMRKKIDSGRKIWKSYKKYKFRRQINDKLKLLVSRIRLWKKICAKQSMKIQKHGYYKIKEASEYKKQQERILMNKKLTQAKQKRQEQQKKRKQLNISKRSQNQHKHLQRIAQIRNLVIKRNLFTKLKSITSSKKIGDKPKQTKLPGTGKRQQTNEVNMDNSMMNQSIVIDDNRGPYQRVVANNIEHKKSIQFNQTFLNEKSILVTGDKNIIFEGSAIIVPMFNLKDSPTFEKLRLLLFQKYEQNVQLTEQEYFSPASDDTKFQIQDVPNQIMNKIINFDSAAFFKRVLRKRTNFFGMQKDEDQILVVKMKPLSKSLTSINEADQKQSLKIFKTLLKIIQQSKLENVYKLIQIMITQSHGTPPEVKNEVFLQLIKQSNSQVQLASVRIFQTLAVFLHIFSPDPDFLYAGMNFFFKRLSQHRYTQKQDEYVRYLFKKILRKISRVNVMSYMPIKYQIMALMCKRQVSMQIYLPVGSSVVCKIQSYQTFGDIKEKVMDAYGINKKRLVPQLFAFYEIVNFDNHELQENPLHESMVVWDIVTYWQKAKQKYREKGIVPPIFFLMLKFRYTVECHYEDEQVVELMYGQAFFQYFLGRIVLPLQQMGIMAGIIKHIKFSHAPPDDINGSYPVWAAHRYKQQDLVKQMQKNVELIKQQKLQQYDLKFKFLTLAATTPLCLSMVITSRDLIKYAFKPKKLTIVDKNVVIQQYPIKSITKYSNQGQRFLYTVRGSPASKIIQTDYANLCTGYLSLLPKLFQLKDYQNNNILSELQS